MGNAWEVWAWVDTGDGYAYDEVYRGESATRALIAAVKAKRAGAGCIRIKWR